VKRQELVLWAIEAGMERIHARPFEPPGFHHFGTDTKNDWLYLLLST
jgi:hypothetical protein